MFDKTSENNMMENRNKFFNLHRCEFKLIAYTECRYARMTSTHKKANLYRRALPNKSR